MPIDLQTILVGAIGAGAGMIAKPVAERLVDRIFNRKPVFAISPHVLRNDWIIKVEPVNSSARRKKPLNLSFKSGISLGVGILNKEQLSWTIDLSKLDLIRDELTTNTFAELQLFFNPSQMSEPIRITYKPGAAPQTITSPSTVSVSSIKSFIQAISSRRKISLINTEIQITDGFPVGSDNVGWTSVFDGKEINISNVSDFEIIGESAALLAQPRYAWVLSFSNCRDLTFNNLTMGHLTAGYCQGGVIRFQNCSGVAIRGCDLYGSGTYGFEFLDCTDINIENTTVRDCSYGILKIANSSSVTFTDCYFGNNREFDLCIFEGRIEQVMLRKCTFERNFSNDSLFSLEGITGMGSNVYVWDCSFLDNHCKQFEDKSGFFSESRNRFVGNSWQQPQPRPK
jgi:hypothetical protein